MFQDRKVTIVTKHEKEKAIGPILSEGLGVICTSSHGIDTDLLGTFSGEIERTQSPVDAARAKCNMAINGHDVDLIVANEGSFFPHPMVPFLTISEEVIILLDRRNDFEFYTKRISKNITAFSEQITNNLDISRFLDKTDFPNHNVIISCRLDGVFHAYKDFTNRSEVISKIHALQNVGAGELTIETDLRAMNNPTRMSEIGEATRLFVQELMSRCPSCKRYGFVVTEVLNGLPCMACGLPTSSPKEKRKECKGCGYNENEPFDNQKRWEEPQFCLNCNP
jgi:hypothetical protein